MKNYHDLLQKILDSGELRKNRTGVDTISVFGETLRFDLRLGFPAITTKKFAWQACKAELLWMLEGSGNERRLAEIQYGTRDPDKTTIWTANLEADYWKEKSKFEGDLGRIYGVQWRHWRGHPSWQTIDQIKTLITGIKNDPQGRRHIISAWNPAELHLMALPPCHIMAQFYVSNDNRLSCQMYQRSQDVFLGGPFNIASYSLLTHMIAQVCDLKVGEFIHVSGDTHLYVNHIEQVKEQLSRESFPLPELWLNPEIKDIFKFTMDDIKLINYQSHSALKAPMAV